jgi:hypothetical protein
MKVTEKKKENWISRLDNLKGVTNNLCNEVTKCEVFEDEIDFLSTLMCDFDEAIAEIQNLKVHP